MNKRTIAIAVFLLLTVACVAHALWYYPRLPAQVAHHFDASGRPDAWGSKLDFLASYLATIGVTAVTFLGIGLLMPKLPNRAINLPNKDYWLAPERRRQTMDSMLAALLWFGSLTMLLLLGILHQSFQVHLGNATRLDHVWDAMGGYMVLATVWCVAVYRRFSKKES